MIQVPTDPIYSMESFFDCFGTSGTYVAPDGTRKAVRVVFIAPYTPIQYGDGVAVQNESPMAIGAAADFWDARDAGADCQLWIGDDVYTIVGVEGGVTGEVTLTLSEFAPGSSPGT